MLQYLVSVRLYRHADVCTQAPKHFCLQKCKVLQIHGVVCGLKPRGWISPSGHLLAGPQTGLCPQHQGSTDHHTQFAHLSNGQTRNLQNYFPLEKFLIPVHQLTTGSNVTVLLPGDRTRLVTSSSHQVSEITISLCISFFFF